MEKFFENGLLTLFWIEFMFFFFVAWWSLVSNDFMLGKTGTIIYYVFIVFGIFWWSGFSLSWMHIFCCLMNLFVATILINSEINTNIKNAKT